MRLVSIDPGRVGMDISWVQKKNIFRSGLDSDRIRGSSLVGKRCSQRQRRRTLPEGEDWVFV